jgi:hypothetical protein
MLDDVDWGQVDVGRFAAIGGAFTLAIDAAIYPLEVVKTKLQVQARAAVSVDIRKRGGGGGVDPSASVVLLRLTQDGSASLLSSVVNTVRATWRRDGWSGFYRGFALYTFGGLPSQG